MKIKDFYDSDLRGHIEKLLEVSSVISPHLKNMEELYALAYFVLSKFKKPDTTHCLGIYNNVAEYRSSQVRETAVVVFFTEKSELESFFHKDDKLTAFFKTDIYKVEGEFPYYMVHTSNRDKRYQIATRMIIMMPSLTPDVFKDYKSDTELLAILKKLIDGDLSVVGDFFEPIDVKREILLKALKGFSSRSYETQIQNLEDSVEHLEMRIQEIYESVDEYRKKITIHMGSIMALRNKIEEGVSNDNELIELFSETPGVEFIRKGNNNSLVFSCETFLTQFDPDSAKIVINNTRSVIYNSLRAYDNDEKRWFGKLFENIFVKEKWKMKTYAVFNLSEGAYCSPVRQDMPRYQQTAIGNPHLMNYGCTGSFSQFFDDAKRNMDFQAAVITALSSTASLNFNDHTVLTAFCRQIKEDYIYNRNRKYIVINGEAHSVSEAIGIIKEEEKKESVSNG